MGFLSSVEKFDLYDVLFSKPAVYLTGIPKPTKTSHAEFNNPNTNNDNFQNINSVHHYFI